MTAAPPAVARDASLVLLKSLGQVVAELDTGCGGKAKLELATDSEEILRKLEALVQSIRSSTALGSFDWSAHEPFAERKRAPDGDIEIQPSPLLHVWSCCCKLWNMSIEDPGKKNGMLEAGSTAAVRAMAILRHSACELASLVPGDQLGEDRCMDTIRFAYGAALPFMKLNEPEQAEMCLSLGGRIAKILLNKLATCWKGGDVDVEQGIVEIWNLQMLRLKVLFVDLSQYDMAIEIRDECCAAVCGSAPEAWMGRLNSKDHGRRLCCDLCLQLAWQLLDTTVEVLKEHTTAADMHAVPARDSLEKALMVVDSAESHLALADGSKDSAVEHAFAAIRSNALVWLMWCHIMHDDYEKSLQCFTVLQAKSEETASLETALAMKALALASTGKLQDAESQLLFMASNESISPKICLEVAQQLLERGCSLKTLVNAMHVTDDRQKTTGILSSALALVCLAAFHEDMKQVQTEDLDELLLNSMGERSCFAKQVSNQPDNPDVIKSAAHAHALLWNRGIRHFSAKRWEQAVSFFEMSMNFSSSSSSPSSGNHRAWQAMALAYIAQSKLDRALECLNQCSSQPSISTAYIYLKVFLEKGNHDEAVKQVQNACICADFVPAVLEVFCQEAVKSRAYVVAKEALVKLHAAAMDAQRDDRPKPVDTSEGALLRSLIVCILSSFEQNGSKESKAGSEEESATAAAAAAASGSARQELAKYLMLAGKRLEELGYNMFFGDDGVPSKPSQLEWLATVAWNRAHEAASMGDFESAAPLLAAHASLVSKHPSAEIPRWAKSRRTAYALASAAALEVHARNPTHDASLSLAMHMIMSCHKATDDETKANMDEIGAKLFFQEFHVALRSKDEAKMDSLLADCIPKAAALLPAIDIVRLAVQIRDSKLSRLPITQRCFALALSRVMTEEMPDMQLAAEIIRSLIVMASNDNEKLKQYKEAHSIISNVSKTRPADSGESGYGLEGAGAKEHSHAVVYPEKEMRWLVATCWNKGSAHLRFSRYNEALAFMQTARKILEYCPCMIQEYKQIMTQGISMATQLQQRQHGQSQ